MIPRSAVLEAGDALLPVAREGEGPIFNEAWQAEAFAMVVALHGAKLFSWSEWTAALAREIAVASQSSDRDPHDSYYRHWLAALERIVVDKGAASRSALEFAQGGMGAGGRGDAARRADPARQRSAIGRFALAPTERQARCQSPSPN